MVNQINKDNTARGRDLSGELLNRDETISLLRTSSSSLDRGIKAGRIPEPIRITGKPLWARKQLNKLIYG